MKLTASEKEICLSREIQAVLSGACYEEAKMALTHAAAVIAQQRDKRSGELIFHPEKGEDTL